MEVDGVRRAVAGISRVFDDTAAARAGIRPGEAVAEVDGETVASAESLVAQIREREPGTRVALTVVSRSGSARDVAVRFGTQPAAQHNDLRIKRRHERVHCPPQRAGPGPKDLSLGRLPRLGQQVRRAHPRRKSGFRHQPTERRP